MRLVSFTGLAPARVKIKLWSPIWGFTFTRMPPEMTAMSGLVWIAMCGPVMVMRMRDPCATI